jgi:hypothetical protein
MNGTSAAAAGQDAGERYIARIEEHLARLAQGHDSLGHLFAIERLARGARAEWLETQRAAERERRGP